MPDGCRSPGLCGHQHALRDVRDGGVLSVATYPTAGRDDHGNVIYVVELVRDGEVVAKLRADELRRELP